MAIRLSKKRRVWLLLCVASLTLMLLAATRWMRGTSGPQLHPSALTLHSRNAGAPIAWVRGQNQHTGYLRHVHEVLSFLGYTVVNYTDAEGLTQPWDLLWSHAYPFKELRPLMLRLQPHQRVNHFPGSGFISNKVTLAESELKSVPHAFRIPKDREKLLNYAKLNPAKLFVQKSNNHRGIAVKPLSELDLSAEGSFVQEFVHNPLLIDGHKFDIGLYVVLTSVRPLRVYIYWGDVLFRFCPEKYHPFDPAVKDKYVVGDDYMPTWKVSSLIPYYTLQGFGMKQSFDAWLRDQDKDPELVWKGVRDAISEVFYAKEDAIIGAVLNYKRRHNFFEMMRFDLIVDADLHVYLMEANMSPNLSSAHFKQNKLLYRQVVKHVLGVATLPVNELMAAARLRSEHLTKTDPSVAVNLELSEDQQMNAAFKDVSVFPEHCATNCAGDAKGSSDSKGSDCDDVSCQLCQRCVSSELLQELLRAHGEHQRRGMTRRLLPPPITPPSAAHTPANISHINPDNTLITEWFRGKCLLDDTFCS
ncbi:tubulin-tyrosine ligase-like [Hyalella azteca]|uniref:Probable tubulin polyglutamylase ttll-15 n=1 Tax=Hyalella azteca TaxID=294128 RepID=A0A6A0GS48_HYAAZ|nr:probable tubulin polyglutamylase ttll-15 [Hyalella azteca]KAA0184449.1 tubulin-tyrosine ligase-like [Hyalella azteca]